MIQFLYYFNSDDYCLMETKRTDLSIQASLSEIYKWVLYDRKLEKYEVLDFRNMIKADSKETRSFSQGELEFNQKQAEFKYNNKKIKLNNDGPTRISNELKHKTSDYLLGLI